jgi:hypothetical protein
LIVAGGFITLFPSCQKETITETIVETDTVTIDLKRGLIAYYPFTGNANDSSGNNKHGQLMNGLVFGADAHGNPNKAASFDGVDDYIVVADPTNYFAPPKMSVSFQINFNDVNARNSIMSKSAFSTPSSVSWGINLTNKLAVTVADPTSASSPCGVWSPTTAYDTYSNTTFQNNRWYHVTMIYNLGVKLIYIDGALNSASVSNYNNLMQCSLGDFKIGGWWQNDVISIHGKMDELRIYNRILAENEIEKLAQEIN